MKIKELKDKLKDLPDDADVKLVLQESSFQITVEPPKYLDVSTYLSPLKSTAEIVFFTLDNGAEVIE